MIIESVFTLIFTFTIIILAFRVKSILYVGEHNSSIQNELNTFDENFNTIQNIENNSDFELGSGHLYE